MEILKNILSAGVDFNANTFEHPVDGDVTVDADSEWLELSDQQRAAILNDLGYSLLFDVSVGTATKTTTVDVHLLKIPLIPLPSIHLDITGRIPRPFTRARAFILI